MSTVAVRPCLYLLSDYNLRDVGNLGALGGTGDYGFSKYFVQNFPDLNFDYPDVVKVLETVEVEYESLREVTMSLSVFRGRPLGDPGTLQETVTMATKASAGDEPGVFWSAAWTAGVYASLRLFRYTFPFAMSQGKTLSVGLKANVNLVPFRLVRMTFRFTPERTPQLGSGVLRTP